MKDLAMEMFIQVSYAKNQEDYHIAIKALAQHKWALSKWVEDNKLSGV